MKNDIETPALIIDMDSLEYNIRLMSDFMKEKSAKLRPHFKTHKCPAIAHLQLAAGAKGITCAKLSEAEVCAAAGIGDILIANQIVDAPKVYRLAGLARETKITVCVDREENIDLLSHAAADTDAVIHVLVEVDIGMGRCGVSTAEETLLLAEKISAADHLVFDGLQAYAGHLGHLPDAEERCSGVRKAESKIQAIKNALEEHSIPVKEISGGSTGTYAITGSNGLWTEIQAGSYIFMDTAYGMLGLDFKNSLSVLCTIIHKRPGAAVTDAGLKCCGTDQTATLLKGYPELAIELNEEHGIIRDPADQLSFLQRLEYIPGHCCSTVNLFDTFYCVRSGRLECTWPIVGRGMSR